MNVDEVDPQPTVTTATGPLRRTLPMLATALNREIVAMLPLSW